MPDNGNYQPPREEQYSKMTCTSGTVFIALPKRFLRALAKAGSEREFSRRRGVNIFYVSQLLRKGIEPTNPEIRAKLYLPRRKRKPRAPKPEAFPGQKKIEGKVKKKIGKMAKETRQPDLYQEPKP